MHSSGIPLPPTNYNDLAEVQDMVDRLGDLVVSFESRVFRLRDRKMVPVLGEFSVKESRARDKDEKSDNKEESNK